MRISACVQDNLGYASDGCIGLKKLRRFTWKTPHDTPHIASPNARTDKDGAKNGIKIITAIHAIKNIIVGRQPNLS
jgi:hypothetical protein